MYNPRGRAVDPGLIRSRPGALQMAARASVMMSGTTTPAARSARLWPAPRPNKNGVSNARPHHASLERSGRLLLFRGHRLVLFYWRWFGLVVFERDNLLGSRSQRDIMGFREFGRKPV